MGRREETRMSRWFPAKKAIIFSSSPHPRPLDSMASYTCTYTLSTPPTTCLARRSSQTHDTIWPRKLFCKQLLHKNQCYKWVFGFSLITFFSETTQISVPNQLCMNNKGTIMYLSATVGHFLEDETWLDPDFLIPASTPKICLFVCLFS